MESVTLTSRKPVHALAGTPFISAQGIQLDELTEDTVVFDGPAADAACAFPATSNVAAALALTVGDRCEVRVRVVASPQGVRNIHEIEACGEFGSLRMLCENVPSEANPKTSKLAALSALATLATIAGSPLSAQMAPERRVGPTSLSIPATASK
jgi:aspartate dehydrogenase